MIITIKHQSDGRFIAKFPALPAVSIEGETPEGVIAEVHQCLNVITRDWARGLFNSLDFVNQSK
jgi:predicted RNase H-like HicB family nuclease